MELSLMMFLLIKLS